jgi:release factor glutamine methyltransferase
MNLQEAQERLLLELKGLYDEREAGHIADWVMEKSTGLKKIDRLLKKNEPVPIQARDLLKKYSEELSTHRPVQYVLQESWFCGLKFFVDEHVLIPRPETEELVQWVLEWMAGRTSPAVKSTSGPGVNILDVGTGSGCIAIALKKRFMEAAVSACDVSAEALAIARRNAATHDAAIRFQHLDFLDCAKWAVLPAVDAIVSNPPYVPLKDKQSMAPHVVGFEPHLALFVQDDDPLLFYRAIGGFAKEKLLPGGALFVETHEELAGAVATLFRAAGFSEIIVKNDIQGKDRMIKATW